MNETGFWVAVVLALLCSVLTGTCSHQDGYRSGVRDSRLPCLNPEAVQVALDGCLAARQKLKPEPMTSSGASDLFEACREWAVDVACVRASMPAGAKP